MKMLCEFIITAIAFLILCPTGTISFASPSNVAATRRTSAQARLYAGGHKENDEQQPYRSISYYMGGWHAGKFDFDDRLSGVTALNYEKSVVFEADTHDSKRVLLADAPDEKPAWASRPVDYSQCRIMLPVSQRRNSVTTVTITNEELSWEPFWATIEPANELCTLSPTCGTLAPRGGADKYSECCHFNVKGNLTITAVWHFLVVRTEQDVWVWRLEPA